MTNFKLLEFLSDYKLHSVCMHQQSRCDTLARISSKVESDLSIASLKISARLIQPHNNLFIKLTH